MFKFKSLTLMLVLLVGLFSFAEAQTTVPAHQNVAWGNGTYISDALVMSALLDTSATFTMRSGETYPDRVSFLSINIKGANSDSTNTVYTLDMSNDGTYWVAWGTIETILDIATAAETNTGTNTLALMPSVTDADQLPAYKYGRIRVAAQETTSADTVTCRVQITKQFLK